ncbi:MAG: amidohydrolase family protein [Clostridia bacterium]|nr:amidohydrolase family protein [Clostridia bacterium]
MKLIQNATIIDGTGAPAFAGAVLIDKGKIERVAKGGMAVPLEAEVMDASGLTLTPGFIDAHSHGDLMLESAFSSRSKFSQGVTTQAAGQCGVSMWPADTRDMPRHTRFVSGISPCPTVPPVEALASYKAYRAYANAIPHKPKTELFTGHGALRLAVMGYDAGKPTRAQMAAMQTLLREAMAGGSLGLSTGLVYAPGCYGQTEELIALLRVVHDCGGVYATHVRDESNMVEEAEEEALLCAERAGVPIFISHFKAAGKQNWGKPARILKKFDAAIARGVHLTVDHYPYLAGQTSLNVSIPPRYRKDGMEALCRHLCDPVALHDIRAEMAVQSDYDNYIYNSGGFDGVMVAACPLFKDAEGMTIAAYADKTGQAPFDAYIDILRRNEGLGLGVYFHMCEDDLLSIARYPHTVLGTDGLLGRPDENGHPRAFGTFPHAICYYVKEKGLFTLEEMIHRMTGLPAARLGLKDRGAVREGMAADLVLMDYPALHDRATYKDANLTAEGIACVLLDGEKVYGV